MVTSTPRASFLHQLQGLDAPAPIALADDLVMRDLSWQPAFLPDPNGLAYAVQHVVGFLAHMRDVDPTHPAHDFGQLDYLLGGGIVAGDVAESRGEPERAVAPRP